MGYQGLSDGVQGGSALKEASFAHLNREFKVEYQPVMSLSGKQIVGFEMLLGWQEQRGEIYSSEGLSMLDDTGLGLSLRSWLLRTVINQLYFWNRQFLSAASLSVNVQLTKKQWLAPGLVETLQSMSQEFQWQLRGLTLEIPYTLLVQCAEPSAKLITDLQKLGITVQISQVMPTHSVLVALQYFGIPVIKVDQAFMRNLVISHGTLECFKNVLQKLQAADITIIVPGIETPEQVDLLMQLSDSQYLRGGDWNVVCAMPMSPRETTLLINTDSRLAQSSITTYLSAMNRLSQFVQGLLGAVMVERYWLSTQPRADWLSANNVIWQSSGFLYSSNEFSLSQQQIQDLESWVKQFMLCSSHIIRDLPKLLRYSGLTVAEAQLLRL